MDPRQLLHNLDQVVCGGLSLHSAAIIILQQGKGRVVRAKTCSPSPGEGDGHITGAGGDPAPSLPWQGGCSHQKSTPPLRNTGQQGLLMAKLIQRLPPGTHFSLPGCSSEAPSPVSSTPDSSTGNLPPRDPDPAFFLWDCQRSPTRHAPTCPRC